MWIAPTRAVSTHRIELSSFGIEHVRTHPENMMSFGSLETWKLLGMNSNVKHV